MAVSSISVALFKKMVMNGAINLKNNHKEIDELNVFPVPDGDTGTNMSMTVMSGVREMNACESSSINEVAKFLSRGALMGARGNSGVILSQFFRGLYVGISKAKSNTLSVEDFMVCLEGGKEIAYKAVMEPIEGTILTVIREATDNTKAKLAGINSINALLETYYQEALVSLANTPNLLPVLKEAGVVDSGAAGFCKIIDGMIMALLEQWRSTAYNETMRKDKLQQLWATYFEEEKSVENKSAESQADVEIKFGYCTEFIIELNKPASFDEQDLKAPLSLLGDSLVVVQDEDIVKIHVHTNKPGKVLNIAQKYGEFVTLKIENMRLQHSQLQSGAAAEPVKTPKKQFALVSVCFGEGIVQTFKDLGVDYVIEGGQTMNPSTESFLEAINAVNAENVIIIPNNGNVIMAANQAASMAQDCNVQVIKAKTIAQGYASLMYFDPEGTMEANVEQMSEAIANVKSGEITYSIRDTEINGVKINSGDFMGIANGHIVVSTEKKHDALVELLNGMIGAESQIITFFCGSDITKEEQGLLEGLVSRINPDCDVEIIEGKQDIYSYIIAVE
ncbi:MAG: DAK2 domain-containing protein [Acholeplasmatales bacterium]|nr:DAK2 domain-containing protein [Acholeplasmatales bacterium]